MVKTRITDEEGKEVGAILSKESMKKTIFCLLCGKAVSDSKHYNETYSTLSTYED